MEILELLGLCVQVLDRLGVRYFVTGSLASMYYGEPRLTHDVDIVVELRSDHVAALCRSFPIKDFYVSEDAVLQAVQLRGQFNILHPASGLKADLMVPADTPFDRIRFTRAVRARPTPGFEAWFSSPEDVIINKLKFYREGGSEKHLRDITGVLKVSGGSLDLAYITEWAVRLGVEPIWEAVHRRGGTTDVRKGSPGRGVT